MEELTFYWSNDGQSVVVIGDDGEEEQFSREEFLELDIADEPYKDNKGQQNLEEMEKYYEQYFEEHFSDDSEQMRKPTRPIRESIYDSSRWRGLKDVENFLKIEDRKALLDSLKKDFRLSDAERGYYSLKLELTYLAGDLSWAKSARENQGKKEEVTEMLKKYNLEGLGIDFQVTKAIERLRQAFDELDEWHKALGMPTLSQAEKDMRIEFLLVPKKRTKFRKVMVKELAKVCSADVRPIQLEELNLENLNP